MRKLLRIITRYILVLTTFMSVIGFSYGLTQRHIGLSKQYSNNISSYIVDNKTFTGKAYCKEYFYINSFWQSDINDPVIRTVISSVTYTGVNVDTGVVFIYPGVTPYIGWTTAGISSYGNAIGSILGTPIINKGFLVPPGSVDVPEYFTVGRFSFKNKTGVQSTIFKFFNNSNSNQDTDMFDGDSSMELYTRSQKSGRVVFIPEPCVFDGPMITQDKGYITHQQDSRFSPSYRLRNEFSLNDVTFFENNSINGNIIAGRPITLGGDFSVTTDYLPGEIQNRRSINQGISLTVKEPDVDGTRAFTQNYGFTGYQPITGSRIPTQLNLTNKYIRRITTNQRGIDPQSIKIYLSGTFTNKLNFKDVGTKCLLVFSGTDIDKLVGLGVKSWNQNELGYKVAISSGKIAQLAQRSPCNITNAEYKRETTAQIRWYAEDYSRSLKINHNNNSTRVSGNRIYGPINGMDQAKTGYYFNRLYQNPTITSRVDSASMYGDQNLSTARDNVTYNINLNAQRLYFVTRDERAGINSGTIEVIISGYTGLPKEYGNRGLLTTPIVYKLTGSKLNITQTGSIYDRPYYQGFIDFAAQNIILKTGMEFDIYISVKDFSNNKGYSFFSFKTPTRPYGPAGGPVYIDAYSKEPIIDSRFQVINNIRDRSPEADPVYDYSSYYNDNLLISGFNYKGLATSVINVNGYNGGNINEVVILSGLHFIGNGRNSYITGTPVVYSGSAPVGSGKLKETTFSFNITALNKYGRTGSITYIIKIYPSCADADGCLAKKIMMSYGTTVSGAYAMMQTSGIWYNHWFVELLNTTKDFMFSGVNQKDVVLFCAGTGSSRIITQTTASGPGDGTHNYFQTNPGFYVFSGTTLDISGQQVNQFGQTGVIKIEYSTQVSSSGRTSLAIHIIRPLTGKVEFSNCEFNTGGQLDYFGCPIGNINHNRTGDIKRAKLTGSFYATAHIFGGRFTGTNSGFWNTGYLSYGGGKRDYVFIASTQNQINTSGTIMFNLINRTGLQETLNYEIYRIDNTPPSIKSGLTNFIANKQITLILSGINTGQLSNSKINNLIGDDEYIITNFSGIKQPLLYTASGYGHNMTYSNYINNNNYNGYNLNHEIVFGDQRSGYIYYMDRAGNTGRIFITIPEIRQRLEFIIKGKSAFRSIEDYSINTGDFRLFSLSGLTWIELYNSNINVGIDPKIKLNKNGTGSVFIIPPQSGQIYMVAYKGIGHLSIGYTGIFNDNINSFDFTTTSGNDNLSKNLLEYNTLQYQDTVFLKPGDIVAYNTGNYDVITNSDLALINNSLTLGYNNYIFNDIYDFDINKTINNIEQAIVIQLTQNRGYIGRINYINLIPINKFISNF